MKPRQRVIVESTDDGLPRAPVPRGYCTDATTEADFPAIKAEAHQIAKIHGLGRFAASSEWPTFVAWFRSLGATKMRWFEEWSNWCARAKRNVAAQAEPVEPMEEGNV